MVRTKWIIVGIVAAISIGILLAVFWNLVVSTIGAALVIILFFLVALSGGGSGSEDEEDDDDDEDED